MAVDLPLVQRIVEPLVVGLALYLVNRFFERRARLIFFNSNVGFFRLKTGDIHTHSIVIRSAGKLPAHSVRLPHNFPLAVTNINVSVLPQINYTIQLLPTGGDEVLFPLLAPGQTVTVSYLYFPPINFNQIHQAVVCDEGTAHELRVQLQQQYSQRVQALVALLLIIGVVTCVYLLFELSRWLAALSRLTS
jgi:hypothetical protein